LGIKPGRLDARVAQQTADLLQVVLLHIDFFTPSARGWVGLGQAAGLAVL
jgi:hypothetical protein